MLRSRVPRCLQLWNRRLIANDASDVAVTSGVPIETYSRKATIYTPARTASQQGLAQTVWGKNPSWKIDFDNSEKWENPLMGWTSTADPLENTFRAEGLAFYTKEEAVEFCRKHGWQFEVLDYNERKINRSPRFAAYGDNFSTKRSGIPDLSGYRSNKGTSDPPSEPSGGGQAKPAKGSSPSK